MKKEMSKRIRDYGGQIFNGKEIQFILGLLEYRILTLDFWAKKKMKEELRLVKKLRNKFEKVK